MGPTVVAVDLLAVQRLKERIANQPKQINNSSLPAGSPMYFYCKICGHQSDVKPESYVSAPNKYCEECKDLKDTSKLTDKTLLELAQGK